LLLLLLLIFVVFCVDTWHREIAHRIQDRIIERGFMTDCQTFVLEQGERFGQFSTQQKIFLLGLQREVVDYCTFDMISLIKIQSLDLLPRHHFLSP
jgi:hypothetical protein